MNRGLVVGWVVVMMSCAPASPADPCAGRAPGDLVISEVMVDPDGTDTGAEWIELFNPLDVAQDLKGVAITTHDLDGSNTKSHVIKLGTIEPGGYFVLGDVRSGANPAWIDSSYADALGSLGNARGALELRCGATVLDQMQWSNPVLPARSLMLSGGPTEPSASANDDEARWCAAPSGTVYFGPNAGTPGVANPVCPAAASGETCLGDGVARPIVPPAPGELEISEVMNNPSISETTGEWLEVLARAPVDLNGLTIANGVGSSDTLTSPTCLRVNPGQYVLLSRSADPVLNGGLPAALATYSVSFTNGAERVILRHGDAGIAEATLKPSSSGRSWQLDPSKLDSQAASSFCVAPRRWNEPANSDFGSPGRVNPPCSGASSCSGHLPGDLVISEVMVDPDGLDTGNEWIELYNPASAPEDLTGVTVSTKDASGAVLATHSLGPGVIPAHGYVVLGDVRGVPNPSWVDFTYGADLGSLTNGAGWLSVACGTTVLDEMKWSVAARPARSRMLGGGAVAPDALANDLERNWCDTPAGIVYFTPNAGTPGAPNPPCVVEALAGTCLENGAARPLVQPRPGDLFITEVMANPNVSQTTGEWFEVLARAEVDLNELTVANGSGGSSTITSADCLHVHAGETVVLARSLDAFVNGGLPPPRAQYSLSLANGPERLSLRRGDAGLDEVAFLASASGVSWQFDPSRFDGGLGANDDPTSFCPSRTPWTFDGGGLGSPGLPNPACGAASTCVQADGGLRPTRFAVPGDLVITEWLPDPLGVSDALGEYFEVLANRSVDLNGVLVGDGAGLSTVQADRCLEARAGSYLVFARSADPFLNGGLPRVDFELGFELNNRLDTLRVHAADGGVLDELTYTTGTFQPGVAWQLRPGLTSPADNDSPANLCATPPGNALKDGDLGTPGHANPACP